MRGLSAMLLILLVLAAGCGGDGKSGTGTTGATATSTGLAGESGTSAPGPTGTTANPSTGGATAPAPGGTSDVKPEPSELNRNRVERYLTANYGGGSGDEAPWFGRVKSASAAGETTTVKTDLRSDAKGRRSANDICQALIGAIPGTTDIVRVTGKAGGVLARCVP
jgi:hypothetical protein